MAPHHTNSSYLDKKFIGCRRRNSHQLPIRMSVHSCALLEAALRGEERAIKNGSHGEHSTYDGTCSVGVVKTKHISELKRT